VNSNNTASGNRSGNSWTGVVSLGAPFDSGGWILEPQALVSYTNTSLDRFSEGGVKHSKRLRYHEMEIDNVDTELSMKFTYPIRDGQRSLFMPSLRLGWAADWGNSGDNQKVSYVDSGDAYRIGINGDADHGALIELGLDYTSFNFNDTSMGVYARTGVVIWGDRGTSWQVQGGLNFRF
jgi:outer membrane autotransporter protein